MTINGFLSKVDQSGGRVCHRENERKRKRGRYLGVRL